MPLPFVLFRLIVSIMEMNSKYLVKPVFNSFDDEYEWYEDHGIVPLRYDSTRLYWALGRAIWLDLYDGGITGYINWIKPLGFVDFSGSNKAYLIRLSVEGRECEVTINLDRSTKDLATEAMVQFFTSGEYFKFNQVIFN